MKHLRKVIGILASIILILGFITSCLQQPKSPDDSNSSSSQTNGEAKEESYYYEYAHMEQTLFFKIAKKGVSSDSPYTFNEIKQIKENLTHVRRYFGDNGTYSRKQLEDNFRSIGYGRNDIQSIFTSLNTRKNIIVITLRTKVGEEDRLTYMYIEKL